MGNNNIQGNHNHHHFTSLLILPSRCNATIEKLQLNSARVAGWLAAIKSSRIEKKKNLRNILNE